MNLSSRLALEKDLPLLARMNRHLIEDEGSRNPMNLEQLEARLRGWLSTGWVIRVFVQTETDQIVGYALYQERADEYFPEKRTIYLRQFFIVRELRGQGVGRSAFTCLLKELPSECRVEIDVLTRNSIGHAFWKSMGFEPDYMHMVMEKHE